MKIGFGNDHTGVELKKILMEHLTEKGYECVNYGNDDPNDRTDDYPVPGRKVAEAIMFRSINFTARPENPFCL